MEIFLCSSYRKDAYDIVSFGYIKDSCDLIADPVVVSYVTFVPAALIAELYYGKEHVLYCRGLVLDRKAFVPVCVDPSCKDNYHGGSRRCDRRLYLSLDLGKHFRVVYDDDVRGLFVAA